MQVLNEETMQALCWTLLHSLWQGLLLAVAGGIVIILSKKSSSALRYNLLSAFLTLFILAACFTFAREWRLAALHAEKIYSGSLSGIEKAGDTITDAITTVTSAKTAVDLFVGYFNTHASLVVAIWFFVLSAQCVKLLANIGYIQRIRNYKTHAPSDYWSIKIQELSERLHIRKPVLLLQSEMVKVPVMTGFLKPLILFPFSLMSQLPPEEIEAVLLHELAHVQRRDYLVNLLQRFGEILFFFNPGVLWISSLIRDERENCCDDIAIAHTKNKKEFIHALVAFQEYSMEASTYMMAFPGRKNHLLNRIKRIITNDNKTLNNMEKISLVIAMIMAGCLTIAFHQKPEAIVVSKVKTGHDLLQPVVIQDTASPKKDAGQELSNLSIVSTIDGKKYKLVEVNNIVKEFYVDGERIPNEKIKDYSDILDRIHLEVKRNQEQLQIQNKLLQEKNQELKRQAELLEIHNKELIDQKLQTVNNEALENLTKEIADVQVQSLLLQKKQHELLEKASRLQNSEVKEQMEMLLKSQQAETFSLKGQILLQNEINQQPSLNLQMPMTLKLNEAPTLSLSEPQITLEPLTAPSPTIISIAPIDPVAPVPPVKLNKSIAAIIDDLMTEGIINNTEELSFTLNQKILKVNGVVQSETLHHKLLEKYTQYPKDHIIYSSKNGSTRADVYTSKN